ncbi:MAG: sulfite exporter TauE/SafE family protein [Bacteroidales bacterium]|jgi:sulfite exporter TauE/SafE|nr:sulfite exporter TauE/SafE family protein [Bacteroidales bacterium]
MNDLYIAALMTGLVGSLHCIGMCGPIAVALPLGNKSWFHKFFGSIIYNTGRVATYAMLGVIFGLLGQGIEMAGLQQWASIGLGIVLILSVLFPVLFKGQIHIDRFFFGFAGKLIGRFRKLFSISSYPSLLVIGLLNGLLPCGLVYVAIAGAINTNDIVNGAIYMIIFGIGTIPIMASIPVVGNLIGTNIRKKFKGVVSAFIIILGIIFILRGLSLGIPYISPPSKMLQPHEKTMKHSTSETGKETIPCCH